MNQMEFALALNALLPGCDPEAPVMWAEFAAECVKHEQAGGTSGRPSRNLER